MTGEIPQSAALQEASPNSLSELLSRDPFGFSAKQDREAIVALLREQRVKWEAVEKLQPVKASKTAASKAASLTAKLSADDLGL